VNVSGTFGGGPEITVEAWYKTSGLTGDFQAIASSTVSGQFMHLQLNDSGNIVVYTNTGAISLTIVKPGPVGVWHHIALSAKSGSTRLYLDGRLIDVNTQAFSTINQTSNLRLGSGVVGSGSAGRFFKGQIDEVKIYNRALSQSEILSIYEGRSAGSCQANAASNNNDFANAAILNDGSGLIYGTNIGATKESGEPMHANNRGGASVWYRWQAPATGTYLFTTFGSSFDTLVGVYTGAAVNSLTPLASNDDNGYADNIDGPTLTSSLTFDALAGTTYYIAVDGASGRTGRIVLGWGLHASLNGEIILLSATIPVTVKLIGDDSRSVRVDGNGRYSFSNLRVGGDYVLTVEFETRGGYPWVRASGHLNDFVPLSGNLWGANFSDFNEIINPATDIAGRVTNSVGAGLTGVTITVSGTASLTLVTDNEGYYLVPGLSHGNYTVTPSSAIYFFSPPSRSFNNVDYDVLGADFTGQVGLTISGQTKAASGTPISGVNLTLSGTQAGSQQSDAGGFYEFKVAPGGNYSVAAAKSGVTFSQPTLTFSSVSASQKNADFTTPSPPPLTVQFSAASYNVGEGGAKVDLSVTRSGDASGAASVSFATSDLAGAQNCNVVNGVASSRCDYETSIGSLKFAAGDTSKTISILIIDDAYLEGNENFTVTLSNPSGATLGTQSTTSVVITDNEIANGVNNPIDTAGFFVRLHYLDFLNREPDASGLNFWTGEITQCGTNAACLENKRVNVSAAFYLSIEFQQTGYLVERLYKAAYGNASGASTCGGAHQLPVPVVRLNEFLPDTQQIGQGVIVGQTGWEQVLENNKQTFTAGFVQRSRFTTAHPNSLTAAQFVDALNTNAGNPLSQAERDQLVNDLATSAKTRAQVLRAVAEDADLVTAETNRAFVLMQFFGYLRRNPNDPQDTDYTGYDFWLTKLNQFNGNFQQAEMVKAFITSIEYRQRFGAP
jgi:hypothetical protein